MRYIFILTIALISCNVKRTTFDYECFMNAHNAFSETLDIPIEIELNDSNLHLYLSKKRNYFLHVEDSCGDISK
jgi:hypothetical protein